MDSNEIFKESKLVKRFIFLSSATLKGACSDLACCIFDNRDNTIYRSTKFHGFSCGLEGISQCAKLQTHWVEAQMTVHEAS